MTDIQNPLVKNNWNNLSTFLENINSLYDTFEYSETMLKNQRLEAQREYNTFIKPYKKEGTGEVIVPKDKERVFQHIKRRPQMILQPS